ncbi:MAG: hypothetical protein LBV34_12470, partial [Nocardiopsaceae bacterium]|nr:hypothetical protein [Nocardiopsaceae bacterium]
WADSPGLALLAVLRNYRTSRRPPARTATPTDAEVRRWKDIVTRNLPGTDVSTDRWNTVWRHAAAGHLAFISPEAALDTASRHTAPSQNPEDLPTYVAHSLVAELARIQRSSTRHQPALPWLANADLPTPAEQLGRITRLNLANAEIRDRTTEIREYVVAHPPTWAAPLGPRPSSLGEAIDWEETLTLAAAYRETFRVTADHPTSPLGPRPTGNHLQAQAWTLITQRWTERLTRTPPRNHSDPRPDRDPDLDDALNREFKAGTDAARTHGPGATDASSKHKTADSSGYEADLDVEADGFSHGSGSKFSH